MVCELVLNEHRQKRHQKCIDLKSIVSQSIEHGNLKEKQDKDKGKEREREEEKIVEN